MDLFLGIDSKLISRARQFLCSLILYFFVFILFFILSRLGIYWLEKNLEPPASLCDTTKVTKGSSD